METKNTHLSQTIKALCSDQSTDLRAALNFEISQEVQSVVPDWIELIPAGDLVTGRDGRSWKNTNPQKIIQSFVDNQADIPVDIEHATELKAPQGDPAPAIGWIKALEIRDGAVFGRVEWTESGRLIVASKQYRYLSPVFLFTKDEFEIVRITSVGLTNNHNLFLKSLNHSQHQPEETSMKWIAKLLGLPEDATQEQITKAINTMQTEHQTAMNRAENPSLDKFVPRADFQAMTERATNAEKALEDIKVKSLNEEIDSAVAKAITDGKIAPSTKDYHVAACRQEGGLKRFKEFVEQSPVIASDSNLDGKEPPTGENKAMNSEQKAIAEMFGNSPEDLEKYGN
ncbi:phage protease [Hydrogenovibrio sp. 3SP14C1]|uniref:phage protease n=1 Tax=Hydrogenovibrio sp. 3SP14C1 TaxID=3038774 RepID=UPI002416307D|nr:phage protease [Hydrogenovibrio sp. 3SP14C1]MDG4811665.1 phage protease [Hydrogenovibrio sp. 3SP14C1]